jgi:hypothetical protein
MIKAMRLRRRALVDPLIATSTNHSTACAALVAHWPAGNGDDRYCRDDIFDLLLTVSHSHYYALLQKKS